jgi:hypothetical protein
MVFEVYFRAKTLKTTFSPLFHCPFVPQYFALIVRRKAM